MWTLPTIYAWGLPPSVLFEAALVCLGEPPHHGEATRSRGSCGGGAQGAKDRVIERKV